MALLQLDVKRQALATSVQVFISAGHGYQNKVATGAV